MNNAPIAYFPDGRICPLLMTPQEVAEFLRLEDSGSTKPMYCLERLRNSGKLPAVRISKRSVYRLSDVLEYVAGLS